MHKITVLEKKIPTRPYTITVLETKIPTRPTAAFVFASEDEAAAADS